MRRQHHLRALIAAIYSSQTGGGTSETVRQLGILGANVAYPDYYVEKPVFANIVEQGGPFRRIGLSGTGATLDANEWPTEDFSQTLMSFAAAPDSSYIGTYKGFATFPGLPAVAPTISYVVDGTITTQNVNYTPGTGVMTFDMVISSLNPSNVVIDVANTSGGVTDFRIYRPGVNHLSPTVFTAFENRVNGEFSTLRVMDLDQVNVSTLTDWANRNTLTNWHQGSDRYQFGQNQYGVPNERIVALYSEAGATELWRCAPAQLTSYTAWATTMASSLPVGKKVVLEAANEVWNSAFIYTYHINYYNALVEVDARRLKYNDIVGDDPDAGVTYSSNDTVGTAYFASRANVESITGNGTTATVTFDGAHGLSSGNMIARGLRAGWDAGDVGTLAGVAPTPVAFTVTGANTLTYPSTAVGTMDMDPNGAGGFFFNPSSPLVVGVQGLYDINLRRHAQRSRAMAIAAKAAFTTAGRLADLDTNVSWQSGAVDQMQDILLFMDYLDGIDGLGGSEVIDSIGFAIYCDLTLDRIAGAGLTDQTGVATTSTQILDAIETQVDYADRAYSLANYTSLARDRQKKLRVYELGIDTQGAWNAFSGTNHANVNTANADARVTTIMRKLFDAFNKAGVDQMNFYRLGVGPYDNSGCFYVGRNVIETDPQTGSGSQSNRLQAIEQVLNAPPARHSRHLLSPSGSLTTIDGRDRINYTYFVGGDPYPTIGSAGYFDILKTTHLGYEVTAPAAANYKIQIRAVLQTTATTTGYVRVRGTNVGSFAIANRGGSNTVEESLDTVTVAMEEGVNYLYIGGLDNQAQNSAVEIRGLSLVHGSYAFPVGITGTPALTANKDQPYTGFTVSAYNGNTPYVYSLVGSWPTGITIDSSTGVVSGTPTVDGTFSSLSVRVTDNTSVTADLPTFSLEVTVGDALLFSDNFNSLPDNTVMRSESGWGAFNSAGSTAGLRDLFTAQSGVATWPNDIGDDYGYPGTFIIGRDLSITDQAIEFQFNVTPGASALFWFCANDQQDGIFLNMPSPGNDSSLNKVVAGVVTTLATFTGVAFASGDVVMLRRYGTDCAVYKNNTLVQTNIAIGSFTGGTKAGAGSYLRLGAYNYINWYGPITQLLKP